MVGSAPEWLEDIGVHRPAILVSTSSGWLNDSDLVVAAGDALRGCDVDVVATLPAEPALPAMPDNVHVARYLPHSLVMPRVDLLVCSGGLGVVNRALLAGKPMVAVPRGADGYRVTAAAVAAGVAVGVDQSQLGPETLRAVLLRALEDPAIRTNAEALQRAGSSFDAPVTTANLMESLLGG
jgi:UDP:flavonoid glycosyltransferase YjiC (YdhE family)